MSIFEFNDYREFLRDQISLRPNKGRGELSRLANHLEVNATLISQILSGTKDFNLEQAQKVCHFLVLPALETDFFLLLVQIERAGNKNLKDYFRKKIDEMRKESLQISKRISVEKKLSDLERSVFYSSGLYSAIQLFCSLEKGKSTEQILEKFDISRTRAQEILQFLVSANLCHVEAGLFKMSTQSTHVEKGSPFLLKHHSNWRIAAIQKSENIDADELMFTANVSVSKKDFQKIRETLAKTIQDISKTVSDSPAEDIANLNIDFFWI